MKRLVKRCLLLFLILGLIGAIVVLWFVNAENHRYEQPQSVQFEILPGDSTTDIVDRLHQDHLIDSTSAAIGYVLIHRSVFLPGIFTVPKEYTLAQLMTLLGQEEKRESKLTIPEGWTKEQIAAALPKFNLSPTKFLQLAARSEGTLFPDTYNIGKNTTEQDLYDRMEEQYRTKTLDLKITPHQLILASIVEREAKGDSDRAIIAGIYENRIQAGMKLEADPTVQYAKYTDLGKAPIADGKKDYWAPITAADYQSVISPFNTYINVGLPPAPICNPGLKSLQAAVHPAQTSALYFFHTKSGQLITSNTLAEHNANKAKFLK